jgi:hypothetical protein
LDGDRPRRGDAVADRSTSRSWGRIDAIEHLLADARAGGAQVSCGQRSGLRKSHARRAAALADGSQVLDVSGAAEAALPLISSRYSAAPPPSADSRRRGSPQSGALGLSADRIDQFLISVAVLTLLSEAAETRRSFAWSTRSVDRP